MKNMFLKGALPTAALALVLTACGGGDEGIFVENENPSASGLSATMTVSGSAATALNGAYTTSNIFLNNVTKVDPVDEPETCRMRFSTLPLATNPQQVMDGDIRYLPGTNAVRTAFVSINAIGFTIVGETDPAGARGMTVDRANNRIVFTGAVFTSTGATGQSITLTGAIPMRGNRPEGC